MALLILFVSCERRPEQIFERWTNEKLPHGLINPQVAIEIAHPDYVVGDLIAQGDMDQKDFLAYVSTEGYLLQNTPVYSFPQNPIHGITWWNPPRWRRGFYIKKVANDGDWVRLVAWHKGQMFIWQDGPFE